MSTFTKTPLRLSFFGGGSDYLEFFNENEGAVLGSSIDKYIYIYQLPMSNFSPKKYKLSWRKTEEVDKIENIEHPVVRTILQDLDWKKPINIATMSDLPGGTGLGSSSSFTVGFLRLINHILSNDVDKLSLAKNAWRVEHDLLSENVGVQDQLHAAFGGLNLYKLNGTKVSIEPIQVSNSFKKLLNKSLILVYTGVTRHASNVVQDQVSNTKKNINTNNIKELVKISYEAADKLNSYNDDNALLIEMGKMLHEGWRLKKSFSKKISNPEIDEIYRKGIALGAYGGKLCGAGGGGFVMFLVEQNLKTSFSDYFGNENVMDIALTNQGSEIFTI
jgi:D-glycero-alpha-D-manno-heptose-7-phosphate kinase